MKNLMFFLLLAFIVNLGTAQDESSYMMIMVKHKKSFKMARSAQDFQDLANNFERIANAESDQWHPLYYAALCYINMSFVSDQNEQKDAFLDKAQAFIDKALLIYPDESELFVLQALLYQGKIQIDPAGRGMTYSAKADEQLSIAKKINPENPRIYYLMGLNVLHTPESFGGGPTAACPLFQTAIEKFKNHLPENVLSPTWGGERNQMLYTQYCSKEE
jgi:tetratricopeptide (TPR) repeat protein